MTEKELPWERNYVWTFTMTDENVSEIMEIANRHGVKVVDVIDRFISLGNFFERRGVTTISFDSEEGLVTIDLWGEPN